MSINASDIEAAAIIKQATVDGESVTTRDADDMGAAIQLANNVAIDTAQKRCNALQNMATCQARTVGPE